ncbi:rhodanese-like domain-containing protein [Schaalia hyovaginalis]|uniref:rhodanese-like domain-containing protein n=1 Tax=Schaalia hyovaginalis TaxID=29316 RepID=UPI002E224F71|nr:rhodanese-like domain-containing protein [Schaalia hyovaginalis]
MPERLTAPTPHDPEDPCAPSPPRSAPQPPPQSLSSPCRPAPPPQSASTPAGSEASAEQTPSSGQSSNSGQSSETSTTPLIIDVRTPEEFAAGHLDGAINIDATAADFSERIAKLDPKGAYTLYCRSGNRAARAAELMTAAGFTEVRNAGGLEEAAKSLALPIVTD